MKKVVTGVAVTTLVAGLASGAYAGGKSSCAKGSCGSKGAKKGFFQGIYDWMKGGSSCGKSSCGSGSAKSSCGKGSCGKSSCGK